MDQSTYCRQWLPDPGWFKPRESTGGQLLSPNVVFLMMVDKACVSQPLWLQPLITNKSLLFTLLNPLNLMSFFFFRKGDLYCCEEIKNFVIQYNIKQQQVAVLAGRLFTRGQLWPSGIFSCDQAALWMVQSIRPSVCLSVCDTFFTMFLSLYHHEIFRSYYHWQKWCPCERSRS